MARRVITVTIGWVLVAALVLVALLLLRCCYVAG